MVDLAFDFKKKDLALSPGNDVEIVSGQASVDQRIRTRLFIEQGEWRLDPTKGRLGSNLKDMFRVSLQRAMQEIPLVVREALAPMEDIQVQDVQCSLNLSNQSAIDVLIVYMMTGQGAGTDPSTTSLTVVG